MKMLGFFILSNLTIKFDKRRLSNYFYKRKSNNIFSFLFLEADSFKLVALFIQNAINQ